MSTQERNMWTKHVWRKTWQLCGLEYVELRSKSLGMCKTKEDIYSIFEVWLQVQNFKNCIWNVYIIPFVNLHEKHIKSTQNWLFIYHIPFINHTKLRIIWKMQHVCSVYFSYRFFWCIVVNTCIFINAYNLVFSISIHSTVSFTPFPLSPSTTVLIFLLYSFIYFNWCIIIMYKIGMHSYMHMAKVGQLYSSLLPLCRPFSL